jgi:hypothetical protein
MANGAYDLRSAASTALAEPGAVELRWPDQPGAKGSIDTGLGWMLDPWAGVPDEAADLLRVAAGAYLADALTPRGTTFTRDISLTVAVRDLDRWTGGVGDDVCDLLYWLTGDQWALSLVADDSDLPAPVLAEPADGAPVSLLSGGLDSFLGAIHLLDEDPSVQFVGHKDAAPVIAGAQKALQRWLASSYSPGPSYARVAFRPAASKRERSSRSRSLLFMSLGVAAAAMRGSSTLYVPENGYTSLNLPLHPNRAGALSTRSTHPVTFRRMGALLEALGIGVSLANPFAAMTKGEVMTSVAALAPPKGWLEASWSTVSCGKLDGGRISGGNSNYNCGLCVPCMVRRGTYIAAACKDGTLYLVNEMRGEDREALVARRQGDLDAIAYATAELVDDDAIDAQTWPDDYDLDAATALVQRGLDELAAVPAP